LACKFFVPENLLHDLEGSNVAERSASGVAAGAISLQIVYTADHEKVRSELGAANDPCIQQSGRHSVGLPEPEPKDLQRLGESSNKFWL
jgi:hypothetical protein